MHQIHILPSIQQQAITQRNGCAGPRAFDPTRTAHLIIDMQNGFLEPGAPIEVPMARAVVPSINRISQAINQTGGVNAFIRFIHDPQEKRPWRSWYQSLLTPHVSAERRLAFLRDAPSAEIWHELDRQPQDWVIDKTRFSAFTAGTCDLDDRLQERNIETVIITGTLSNCCSEATARDAHQLGYNVIFVTDGNAALSDEEHNATLNNLYVNFADLADTDTLVQMIQTNGQKANSLHPSNHQTALQA